MVLKSVHPSTDFPISRLWPYPLPPTLPGVDSTSLTRDQIEKLKEAIARQLRYLGKLRTRMERLAFPPNDPLYAQVSEAFDKVHRLSVSLHYLSCDPGSVGR